MEVGPLARALVVDQLSGWLDELDHSMSSGDLRIADTAKLHPSSWPSRARVFGPHEVPRGSLGHWVEITDGTIKNHQVVVPTTWNAAPRDAQDQPGPYEQALVGTPRRLRGEDRQHAQQRRRSYVQPRDTVPVRYDPAHPYKASVDVDQIRTRRKDFRAAADATRLAQAEHDQLERRHVPAAAAAAEPGVFRLEVSNVIFALGKIGVLGASRTAPSASVTRSPQRVRR